MSGAPDKPTVIARNEATRRSRTLDRFAALAMTAAAAVTLLDVPSPAFAQDRPIPVPAVTLYPGDIVSDGALVDSVQPYPPDIALTDRAKIVGKVARRTLLPGKPIPPGALDEPRLVANGAAVRLLFDEPGLAIATTGQALQPGVRGDFIRVRNTESGVIVTGTVQGDGSVKVGG